MRRIGSRTPLQIRRSTSRRCSCLLFTSGTTGMSKAVRCSQGRLARLAYANTAKYGHVREDVDYCCMPLFHGNALMALWAPALANGATVCLTRKFSASGFLPDVRFFGATYFTYVGKALAYLMATPEQPDDHDNTLVRGFGTEASPEDKAEFVRRFGAELFEGYGSSEGAGFGAPRPGRARRRARPSRARENIAIVESRHPRGVRAGAPRRARSRAEPGRGDRRDGRQGRRQAVRGLLQERTTRSRTGSGTVGTGQAISATSTRPGSSTSPGARATGSASTARTPRR